MNIAGILGDHAKNFGERTAIAERRQRITFGGLNAAAIAAAESLSQAGVRPGMRVLVFSPMSIDLYVTVIGLFRLGCVAVFVDPSAGTAHLAGCIARLRPEAFAAVPRAHLLRLMSAAIRAIPIKVSIGAGVPGARTVTGRAAAVEQQVAPCRPGTPAIITFTSGTTGEAKAVVRTHGFLRAQHRAIVESLELAPGDVDLTTLPIFLLANLASGITSIIPDANLRTPGSIDASPVLDQIQAEQLTRTVASPALLQQLAAGAIRGGRRLDSLHKVFTGGAPVFPRTLDAVSAMAPNASIVAVYGSTEAEPIASIDRRRISQADRSAMRHGAGLLAGTPAPSIRVRILPDRWGTPIRSLTPSEFDAQVLNRGRGGEIVVSGEHVVRGYLDGAGDDETKILVGAEVWHRTGDAGYFDDEQRLWLLGRCAAKVSDHYGVLYPLAVECAASDVDGVRRSAFLRHRGRRVLVAETDRPHRLLRRVLLDYLKWAHLEDVVTMRTIPVDSRHNAKIDLAGMRRRLG